MAIASRDDDFYPSDKNCLLCGDDFSDGEPVVFWRGQDQELHLHGGCAGSFVLRLARDAWQVERDAQDGKFELTSRR